MDPESPLGSPLLAEDLARTLATAALHTFPNSTMTQQHVPGPGDVAPATIRRAVAHIDVDIRSIYDGRLNEVSEDVEFFLTGNITILPDGTASIQVSADQG